MHASYRLSRNRQKAEKYNNVGFGFRHIRCHYVLLVMLFAQDWFVYCASLVIWWLQELTVDKTAFVAFTLFSSPRPVHESYHDLLFPRHH